MPPRSITCFHPNPSRSSAVTSAFAPSSFPLTIDRVLAVRDAERIDHHARGHGVERLHDLRARERGLDLLAQRIRVADEERRRHPVGEVEGVRDVHQDLAVEVRLARGGEGLEGGRSLGRVDDRAPRREPRRRTSRPRPADDPRARSRTAGGPAHPARSAPSGRRDRACRSVASWPISASLPPMARPTQPVPSTPIRMPPMLARPQRRCGRPPRVAGFDERPNEEEDACRGCTRSVRPGR